MKCEKCGKVNSKNKKFCVECGTKLEEKLNKSKKEIKKIDIKEILKDKKKLSVLIGIFIALILIIYFALFHRKSYTIDEVCNINVEGYNGYATLTISLKDEYKETPVQKLYDLVDWEISKEENLKNGDIVKIRFIYDEEKSKNTGVKIKRVYEFKVSGLEDGKVLDLFKDLEISYSSKSPYLKLTVTNNSIDTRKYVVRYSIESLDTTKSNYYIKGGYYKNDEPIKITATYDEEKVGEDGYIVTNTSKEYNIGTQDTYFTERSQFTEEMEKEINKLMIEEVKKHATPSLMKSVYCRYYYCSSYVGSSNRVEDYKLSKDPEPFFMYLGYKESVQSGSIYDSAHTAIIGSYKLSFVGDDSNKTNGGKGHVYCTVHFDNIYLTKEGKLSDYDKDEYYISCSSWKPDEGDLKNSHVSGRYQYSDLIKIN